MGAIINTLRENFEREKAKLQGKARSHARLVKNAKDIPGVADKLIGATNTVTVSGPAQPIRGAGVRMHDGKPMVFFTDGSLRHAMGRHVSKAARKALKKARRAAAKS